MTIISHQANANEKLNDNTSHLTRMAKIVNQQKQNLIRMGNKWNQLI